MGFITEPPKTIVTRLTSYGRDFLLSNTINDIKKFAVSDEGIDYSSDLVLPNGYVPSISGKLDFVGNISNNSAYDYKIPKSILKYKDDKYYQELNEEDIKISQTNKKIPTQTLSNSDFSFLSIDRTNTSNQYIGILQYLNFPLTDNQKSYYILDYKRGGYYNTALEFLNVDNVIVISIDDSKFGNIISGSEIKLELFGNLNTYTLYGTLQNNLTRRKLLDNKLYDDSNNVVNALGEYKILLFSDEIQPPNNDPTKSWGDGYGKIYPYSKHGKPLYNYIDVPNSGIVRDKPVGYVDLLSGLVVITDQTIVSDLNLSSTSHNGVLTSYESAVECIIPIRIEQNSFNTSLNPTYNENEYTYITSIYLLDEKDNVIAVGRVSEPIKKTKLDFIYFTIKLVL
jgi:hypothetical protein